MGLSYPIFYKIISEVNINLDVDRGKGVITLKFILNYEFTIGFDPIIILVLKINYIFNHYIIGTSSKYKT